ncbi:hypothetical protein [uncultured Mucilaginibacter sp.]|uniref:hypothetical protein n=2 Tax=uncultured Mucilaginibacter sp. TaxID=797541 RepID=UPI0025E11767|nr:hypothetical protein [uncultured Mucilaginibacter sp.]
MKLLSYCSIFFMISASVGCSQKSGKNKRAESLKSQEQVPTIQQLKKQKGKIDKLIAAEQDKLIVLVKLPNSDKLMLIKNDKFPDEVETTYNFLKDKEGRIILAGEIPFSGSGDWDITYKSYFDKNGKLFAFERIAGFFNSECTKEDGDAAHEDLIKYYTSSGQLIDSTYTLTDSKKRPLVKSKCVFNYDYPYTIIFDRDTYKKANKINIP